MADLRSVIDTHHRINERGDGEEDDEVRHRKEGDAEMARRLAKYLDEAGGRRGDGEQEGRNKSVINKENKRDDDSPVERSKKKKSKSKEERGRSSGEGGGGERRKKKKKRPRSRSGGQRTRSQTPVRMR